MNEQTKAELKKLAAEMPVEAKLQMKTVVQKVFTENNIPYDVSHLQAMIQMSHLTLPTLPPLYANFISSSMLLLYCLIEELETGFIISPIQKK